MIRPGSAAAPGTVSDAAGPGRYDAGQGTYPLARIGLERRYNMQLTQPSTSVPSRAI